MKKLLLLTFLVTPVFADGILEPAETGPPPGMQVEAPAASWGTTGCGNTVIWVLLKNGKFYRIDKEHAPSTPEATKKLMAWLDQGPNDIVELPCATGT